MDVKWGGGGGGTLPFGGRACPDAREKKSGGPAVVMLYCQIPRVGQLACGGPRGLLHDYHVHVLWLCLDRHVFGSV